MAKKGGVHQLQTEVNTDEDLLKFLERDGLLIMDVYTEWCGPCLAMISSLKKIKLEKGGDDLQLAIVKCDGIEAFKRFRNKSEPTWLFASHGKLINCTFGSNLPELMALISTELDNERLYREKKIERKFYELIEMCPIELERYNAKKAIEEETERIEREAAAEKRKLYIISVTDMIMDRAGDQGVTILMPHTISRDLIKKLQEHGDKFNITAKDKKNFRLKAEDLEILHFDPINTIPLYILNHLYQNEAFMVCWKLADTELRPLPEIINEYTTFMTTQQPILDDEGNEDPEIRLPAILKSRSMIISDEEFENCELQSVTNLPNVEATEAIVNDQTLEVDSQTPSEKTADEKSEQTSEKLPEENEENKTVESSEKESENKVEGEENKTTENSEKKTEKIEEDKTENKAEDKEGEKTVKETESEKKVDDKPSSDTNKSKEEDKTKNVHKVMMPGIWSPKNARGHACFMYYFFRHLTDHFLPPDPVPEPPHLAISFEAYKRKDVMEVIEKFPDDILAYGYFTTDDPVSMKLIANSTFKYQAETPLITDKLILKVAKKTSHAILTLAAYGPSYVSQNTEVGRDECRVYFPEDYKNASETGVEEVEEVPEEVSTKKRRKRKKAAKEDNKDDKSEENNEAGDGDEDDDDDDDDEENAAEECPLNADAPANGEQK